MLSTDCVTWLKHKHKEIIILLRLLSLFKPSHNNKIIVSLPYILFCTDHTCCISLYFLLFFKFTFFKYFRHLMIMIETNSSVWKVILFAIVNHLTFCLEESFSNLNMVFWSKRIESLWTKRRTRSKNQSISKSQIMAKRTKTGKIWFT